MARRRRRGSGVGFAGALAADVLLWVAAAIGAVTLVLAGAALVTGVRPVVVRSGSMAPAIPVGSVALVRPTDPASAHVGDVLTIRSPSGHVLTHRLVAEPKVVATGVELRLKGDANAKADAFPVVVRRADRVVRVVPTWGRVVAAASRPLVAAVVGGLVVLLLAVGRTDGRARRPARARLA